MKALIFAAGKGERMRPLTERTPKPLLDIGGDRLIERHLKALAKIGVEEVIVNTSWLAEQFPATLGDGARYGLKIRYSIEGTEPLETGGGMLHALPLVGDAPFIVVNGDIFCDMDLSQLPQEPRGLAHLVFVDNPPQHAHGDFALDADGRVHEDGPARLTYAGIGVYRPQILEGWRDVVGDAPGANADPPRFKLAPLIVAAMRRGLVDGTHHRGAWTDVGTPKRLDALRAQLDGKTSGNSDGRSLA